MRRKVFLAIIYCGILGSQGRIFVKNKTLAWPSLLPVRVGYKRNAGRLWPICGYILHKCSLKDTSGVYRFMIEMCIKKEGLLLNLPTIFDNGIYFLLNKSCRRIKPKKSYYELLHLSFLTLDPGPLIIPKNSSLVNTLFSTGICGIVFEVQLIGHNKDGMFISHHLSKNQFCPSRTRFKSGFSPWIVSSLCQYTHEFAFS